MRVLNLWQKNGVFKIEVIQPLLDMAAGSSSSSGTSVVDSGPDGGELGELYCETDRHLLLFGTTAS